jgi:hypothetical protein
LAFPSGAVGDKHFLLLARQAFQFALRTLVMGIIPVDRSIQRASIGKNRTPHETTLDHIGGAQLSPQVHRERKKVQRFRTKRTSARTARLTGRSYKMYN